MSLTMRISGRYSEAEILWAGIIPSVIGGGEAVALLDGEVRPVVGESPSWDPMPVESLGLPEPAGSLRTRNIWIYVQGMDLSGSKGR